MTEHDGTASAEEAFFRANNIRFAQTPEMLPSGDWIRVDDGITLAGFDTIGEEGSTTPLDYYRETFGEDFAVVRSDTDPDPELEEQLYAVYSSKVVEAIDGDTELTPDVIDVGAIIHERRVREILWRIFGDLERGHVVERDQDIPKGWVCIYPGTDYPGAKQYVEQILMPSIHWCIAPVRNEAGRAVLGKVSVWTEPVGKEPSERKRRPTARGRRTTTGGAVLRAVQDPTES